jgi:DNA-binding MarR family transcriptional regulator
MTEHPPEDTVDRLIADWQRERPELETEAPAVLMRLILVAQHVIHPAGEGAIARHGIQQGEFDVLASLRRIGPPYTRRPSDLSSELMRSRAGMTKRLDNLEAAGLIERTLSTEDRRSFQVALTEKGLAVVDAALGDLSEALNALLTRLTETQRRQLDQALRALMPPA